ncbi:M15 family metallopeptidase [Microbacterium testaceum]|uniref:M15 family metallopeptidase n=1 Tax=Microbacterium testaceum TaxID=2033 RepID=UPI002AC7183C|nr:M15 family metallopeptidase [Microbacterium testaceum]MDZ5146361.1 M15 family metallopeptidase [Microbacterium testaceum]
MKRVLGIVAVISVIATIPVIGVMFLLTSMTSMLGGGSSCYTSSSESSTVSSSVDVSQVPQGPIAGWKHEQLVNAAHIVAAAQVMGLDARAQVVGVMTAMGESSLVNIGYGDWETSGIRNPDGSPTTSIGLFQQQAGWGSVDERMDPEKSATLFFRALEKVDGWQSLEPTIAAHRVQRNQDPYHYEPYFQDATAVVSALTGLPLTDGSEGGDCSVGSDGNYPPANGTEPGPWGGYQNGQIPPNVLGTIPWDPQYRLRSDALQALQAMDAQFVSEFGYHLPINDAYRDYASQVEAKEKYGSNAATPGTSNHGWAMAIDFGTPSHNSIAFGDPTFEWLKKNAAAYGWVHPPWAEPGGSGPTEAWHWEYWGKAS